LSRKVDECKPLTVGRELARLAEAEEALQARAVEAFDILQLDVARYAAADEEAQAALLEERAMGPMKEREANAAAFIGRVRGFLETQSADWRERAGRLLITSTPPTLP